MNFCTLLASLLPLLPAPDAIEPPALVMQDGTTVESARAWRERRRPEIAGLFEEHVYGRAPGRPEAMRFLVHDVDADALDGAATRKQVRVLLLGEKDGPAMDVLLYVPNAREGPAPAFLGLNFHGNHTTIADPAVRVTESWVPGRGKGVVDHAASAESRGTAAERWAIAQTVARGYAVATVYNGDLDPDLPDDANGIHPFFRAEGQDAPRPDDWGTIAAWAWGLSRALDYLEADPDVDATRVAVMGHSRNGKPALIAGARDERFALVISNQSGCGGAALSRRRKGETVRRINEVFPHWFCDAFHAYGDREDELPVDQHLLVAMVAPRPVLVCSAAEDAWADPEGEFLALVGAEPVYELLGTEGLAADEMPPEGELVGSVLGYHVRPGRHGVGPRDWKVFADFADLHLPRR